MERPEAINPITFDYWQAQNLERLRETREAIQERILVSMLHYSVVTELIKEKGIQDDKQAAS